MENYIAAGIIVLIIGAIIFYLVREKKKGVACIGCPHAKQCGGHCSGRPFNSRREQKKSS